MVTNYQYRYQRNSDLNNLQSPVIPTHLHRASTGIRRSCDLRTRRSCDPWGFFMVETIDHI